MTFQWNRWSLKYEKHHDYFVFTSQYLNWWVMWIYCDVFISCLDSHSNGTHSPHHLPHHQWMLCDATFLQILDELCVRTFSAIVHSWVNYFFNLVLYSVVCHHSCFNKYNWFYVSSHEDKTCSNCCRATDLGLNIHVVFFQVKLNQILFNISAYSTMYRWFSIDYVYYHFKVLDYVLGL